VRVKLLPSSFDATGRVMPGQRLTSYLIDGCVAVDAGSLALSLTAAERKAVRDIVLTHAHLDHLATLPIFLDDLFVSLEAPVSIHALPSVIEQLERNVFNGLIYPRFSQLKNRYGPILQYLPLAIGAPAVVGHLQVTAVAVDHPVETVGLFVSNATESIAFSSDTRPSHGYWVGCRQRKPVRMLVDVAYPDRLHDLALESGHQTPAMLVKLINQFAVERERLVAVGIKAAFVEEVLSELESAGIEAMSPAVEYRWPL